MITRALSEKLQLFADLAESVIGPEDAASRSRLLLRGDAPDLQQGETLLKGAITEGTLTPGIGRGDGSVVTCEFNLVFDCTWSKLLSCNLDPFQWRTFKISCNPE